jgi:hypothetical protein
VVIAVLAILAILSFFPIAPCPNCHGGGSVSPQVNADWIRAHRIMLLGRRFSSLGRERCVRCDARGRVTPIGALFQ